MDEVISAKLFLGHFAMAVMEPILLHENDSFMLDGSVEAGSFRVIGVVCEIAESA